MLCDTQMIRIDNISKRYKDTHALSGVSFGVDQGEILGLVGPNGAGKSTLLKSLVGVVKPDSGEIRIAEINALTDPLKVKLRVGYAPGEPALYNSLSVIEFLKFAIGFHPEGSITEGKHLLSLFGVPLSKKTRELSHGMKRKLLLAQALASQAPILILDEPMEGLDPEIRRTAESILLEQAKKGRTVLLSSHDLAGLERTCSQVAFLREGKLLDVGDLNAFLTQASRVLHIRLRAPVKESELPKNSSWQWTGKDQEWRLQAQGNLEDALAGLKDLPVASCRDASGGLEEVFEALYEKEDGFQ